jgi:hypothetical protein
MVRLLFLIGCCLTQISPIALGQSGGWQYKQPVGMVARPAAEASVTSVNRLNFPFPYSGGSVVTLTLKRRTDGPLVSLSVDKGLFNRSYQNGRAQVRFDGGRVVQFSLVAAANGRANIVFVEKAPAFIRQLRSCARLRVQLVFAGQPTREVEFVTQGLKWKE